MRLCWAHWMRVSWTHELHLSLSGLSSASPSPAPSVIPPYCRTPWGCTCRASNKPRWVLIMQVPLPWG